MMLWICGIANGLTLSQHYCHGHLAEISLSLTHASADCGMNDKAELQSGCCHTEQQFFQSEDPAQIATHSLVQSLLILQTKAPAFESLIPPTLAPLLKSTRAPPDPGPPTWIQWGVFLS